MMSLSLRNRCTALAILAISVMLTPSPAASQTVPTMLVFRPHCEELDQMKCPAYDVADPSTIVTPVMKAGDTLDIDVVLINAGQQAVDKVRMWLSYDAEVLQGQTVTISPLFPTVTPGQSDFVPLSGYAKIGASAVAGKEPRDLLIPVARLVFTVKSGPAASTPISFYDQRAGVEGHTFLTGPGAPTRNLLETPLGSLLIRIQPPAPVAASSSSSVSSAASSAAQMSSTSSAVSTTSSSAASSVAATTSSSSTTSSAAVTNTAFNLIQVQNVRAGTQGSTLYVTWDALSHPKLQGYNVYYGVLPGRYLQRRSVSVASRGSVIRDLPAGKTYYVAVKGVNDENVETSFSAEASVEIGSPSTASPAIVGSLDVIDEVAPETVAPSNPVEDLHEPFNGSVTHDIPGASGASSGLALLLLGSAALGAILACRRQMIAARTLSL